MKEEDTPESVTKRHLCSQGSICPLPPSEGACNEGADQPISQVPRPKPPPKPQISSSEETSGKWFSEHEWSVIHLKVPLSSDSEVQTRTTCDGRCHRPADAEVLLASTAVIAAQVISDHQDTTLVGTNPKCKTLSPNLASPCDVMVKLIEDNVSNDTAFDPEVQELVGLPSPPFTEYKHNVVSEYYDREHYGHGSVEFSPIPFISVAEGCHLQIQQQVNYST